ncbi:MAG TPA: DUF748 domain-containing protein [Flavobacteriales bacterium]
MGGNLLVSAATALRGSVRRCFLTGKTPAGRVPNASRTRERDGSGTFLLKGGKWIVPEAGLAICAAAGMQPDAQPLVTPGHRSRRRRIWLWIIVTLLAVRIALPYVLLHFLNERLANMPGYHGHAEDLDLALIRGAYRIEAIHLDRVDSASLEQTPFIAAEVIDLSVEWKALFHGSIVGELVVEHPQVHFTKDRAEPAQVQQDTTDFRDLLHDLMPLRIGRVEMHGGELHYIDPTSSPKVDLMMDDIEVLALNLRNSYDSTDVLPASITVDAHVYGGSFALRIRLNPLADDPTLDLNAEIKDLQLVQLNDFMQAYVNVDVNRGTFGMYSEIATKDRKFAGYVKPILKDLDVLGREDREDPLLRKFWEGLVGTVGDLFTNPRKEQLATKVEFSGNLDGPRANTFYAVIDLVRNAFIQALQPAIDHEIDLQNVYTKQPENQGFLKRLFRKDGKKEKEKEKEKK